MLDERDPGDFHLSVAVLEELNLSGNRIGTLGFEFGLSLFEEEGVREHFLDEEESVDFEVFREASEALARKKRKSEKKQLVLACDAENANKTGALAKLEREVKSPTGSPKVVYIFSKTEEDGESSDEIEAEGEEARDRVTGASNSLVVVPSEGCLLYTSPSPRDATLSRMPSSA